MTAPAKGVAVETGEVVALAPTFDAAEYLASLRGPALKTQQALAAAYDEACRALIGPNDVQKAQGREFKKKSAWLKLARHFSISTYIPDERVRVEMIDGGFLATVVARAVAPWGQTSENVGACSTDEATGRRVITKADAIATAATRALNRAISNLIAMGEVSADEIHGDDEETRRVQLTPATDAERKSVLEDAAKAGVTKETFPSFYESVTGRPWERLYSEDVKALLAESAKRIAKKRPPMAPVSA